MTSSQRLQDLETVINLNKNGKIIHTLPQKHKIKHKGISYYYDLHKIDL